MTYGQFKDRVLQLIFSYTIAGDEIELDYNNQEDYVKLIPGLLNTVQSYIYQTRKIEDSILLRDLECEELDDNSDAVLYHLPDDCIKLKPGFIIPRGNSFGKIMRRFTGYRLIGGNKILCPKGLPDSTIVEYQKRGVPLPDNPPDNFVLRNPDEINEIMPFYVAAFVVVYDDPFRYAVLYNHFEERLQRLAPIPEYTEANEVVDVYGGFETGEWWM